MKKMKLFVACVLSIVLSVSLPVEMVSATRFSSYVTNELYGAEQETPPVVDNVYGAEQLVQEFGDSLGEVVELPEDSEIRINRTLSETRRLLAEADNSPWTKYRSDYYYSHMTENEKKFYDKFDAECLSILTGTGNMNTITNGEGQEVPVMIMQDYISCELTSEQATDVAWIFYYDNPQYYFLKNTIYYYSTVITGTMGFGIYDEFADGSIRADYTVRISAKLTEWADAANQKNTGYDKIKQAHDTVCNAIVYESSNYDQSIASAILFGGKGVCTSYAKCFMALGNKLGYDTIMLTSKGHAWNLVKISGQWYQVDCTWDDQDKKSSWKHDYFLVGDSHIKDNDQNGNHVVSAMWIGRYPSCPADYNSLNVEIKTVSEKGGKTVTFVTGETSADIYYTNDGSVPTPSSTKYEQPLFVKDVCTIKAIGFKDGKSGSVSSINISKIFIKSNMENAGEIEGITSSDNSFLVAEDDKMVITAKEKDGYSFAGWYENNVLLSENPTLEFMAGASGRILEAWYTMSKYFIIYELNGGKITESNPEEYNILSKDVLASPEKKGYLFKGWYFNGSKVDTLEGRTGNLVLAAEWEKVNVKKAVIKKVNKKSKAVALKKISGVFGYEISYSTNNNFKKSETVTMISKNNKPVLKKVKAGKTYYIRVRAIKKDSYGTNIYGNYSKIKTMTF